MLLFCAALLPNVAAAYTPPNGFVPDAETAIRIAVAVWTPIYGAETIRGEGPYKAVLRGDIWWVYGTSNGPGVGGVAAAEISRIDARVISLTHGK